MGIVFLRVLQVIVYGTVAFTCCDGGQVRPHAAPCALKPVAGNASLRMKKVPAVIMGAAAKYCCKNNREQEPEGFNFIAQWFHF